MSRQLAELLLKENLITPAQFNAAEEANKKTREPFYKYFTRTQAIDENRVVEIFSKKYSIPSFDLSRYEIPEDLWKYWTI